MFNNFFVIQSQKNQIAMDATIGVMWMLLHIFNKL